MATFKLATFSSVRYMVTAVFARVTMVSSGTNLLEELEGGSWTQGNSSESRETQQDRAAFTRGADKVMALPKLSGRFKWLQGV